MRRWHMPGKWMSLSGLTRSRARCTFCITALLRACAIRMLYGERVSYEIFFSVSCEPSIRLCAAPTSVSAACLPRGRNCINAFCRDGVARRRFDSRCNSSVCAWRLKFVRKHWCERVSNGDFLYPGWQIGCHGEPSAKLCWGTRCLQRMGHFCLWRGQIDILRVRFGRKYFTKGYHGMYFPGPCQSHAS